MSQEPTPAAWEPVLVDAREYTYVNLADRGVYPDTRAALRDQDTLSRAAWTLRLEKLGRLRHFDPKEPYLDLSELEEQPHEGCGSCADLAWARGVMDARKEQG